MDVTRWCLYGWLSFCYVPSELSQVDASVNIVEPSPSVCRRTPVMESSMRSCGVRESVSRRCFVQSQVAALVRRPVTPTPLATLAIVANGHKSRAPNAPSQHAHFEQSQRDKQSCSERHGNSQRHLPMTSRPLVLCTESQCDDIILDVFVRKPRLLVQFSSAQWLCPIHSRVSPGRCDSPSPLLRIRPVLPTELLAARSLSPKELRRYFRT